MDHFLLEIGLAFFAIALGGSIASKFDKSVIPFYIIAGILIGPFGLGRFSSTFVGSNDKVNGFIDISAEMGIIFLLFFLGLEFSIDKLSETRNKVMKAGIIDLFNLLVGIILGLLIFNSFIVAFLLGGIVYVSSSAIITKSMVDFDWIANDESEPILGILVFEDIFIAAYLSILSVYIASDINDNQLLITFVLLFGFFILLILLIYFGKKFFERVLEVGNGELFLTRTLAVVILVSGFALSIGLSEAIAAFFIGMGFSSTKHYDQIISVFSPVRDLFASIFFLWIGLHTDPILFVDVFAVVLLLIVITTISKVISGYLSGRYYGMDERKSLKVGLGLIPRGEFSLIIASLAVTAEKFFTDPDTANKIQSLTVLYVFLMSIIGTLIMQYSRLFENLLIHKNDM